MTDASPRLPGAACAASPWPCGTVAGRRSPKGPGKSRAPRVQFPTGNPVGDPGSWEDPGRFGMSWSDWSYHFPEWFYCQFERGLFANFPRWWTIDRPVNVPQEPYEGRGTFITTRLPAILPLRGVRICFSGQVLSGCAAQRLHTGKLFSAEFGEYQVPRCSKQVSFSQHQECKSRKQNEQSHRSPKPPLTDDRGCTKIQRSTRSPWCCWHPPCPSAMKIIVLNPRWQFMYYYVFMWF